MEGPFFCAFAGPDGPAFAGSKLPGLVTGPQARPLEKFFADVFKKTSHLHSFLKVLVLKTDRRFVVQRTEIRYFRKKGYFF